MARSKRRQRVRALSATLGIIAALVLAGSSPASAQESGPGFSKAFAPDTIGPGGTSTLTFTIQNDDAGPVEDLAFSDTLPAAVTIATPAAVTDSCDGDVSAPDGGSTLSFSGGRVAGDSSCDITVEVTSATAGSHVNVTGDLTSDEGNSGSATATLIVTTDRPGFSKEFLPDNVERGERSTLTFTVDNSANESAVDAFLTFTDTLPTGLTIADPTNATTDCENPALPAVLTAAPGTGLISLTATGIALFPILAAGETCTVEVDVLATGIGSLVNTSSDLIVRDTVNGPDVPAGKAHAGITVNAADLSIAKGFTDDPIAPGGIGTLRFTIINFDRLEAASGVGFTDDLDAALTGLVAVGPLPSDPCGAGSTLAGTSTLSLTGGSLAPEGSCTFDVSISVPSGAAAGSYTNTTAAVSATVGGSPVTGNVATADLFVAAAPVLEKEFTDDPVGTGDSVTLEFTITDTTQSGGSTDIEFFDELTTFLPEPLSVTLPPVPNPPCGLGSLLTLAEPVFDRVGLLLTGGSLASGASCTFSVSIDIPSGLAAGTYTNTTDPITATVGDETVIGDVASDDLEVVAGPTLRKAFTDDPILPGETVTLEFTLSHDSLATGDATAMGFTDDLTFVSGLTATGLPLNDVCGTGSSLTGTAGDTLLTFAGGTLTPGASCTFSVTLQSSASTPQGTHTNATSEVTATVAGVAVSSPDTSADLTIAALTLAKAFTDDPVQPGGTVTLEFTVDNSAGVVDATAIFFTDDLAAALTGLAPSAGQLPLTDPCGAGSTLSGAGSLVFLVGGAVPAGGSCTFDVTLDVPADAPPDSYQNKTSSVTATIGGVTAVLPPASDDLVVEGPLEIGLIKEFTDDPVDAGDAVTLEFTISNPSASSAISSIGFTDDLAATLSGLKATGLPLSDPCGVGSSLTGSVGDTFLTYGGGTLAAGASCTFSVTLLVPGSTSSGTYSNTTSTVLGDAGAPVSGPAATADLRVEPPAPRTADLSIVKDDSDDPAVAGDSLTYSVTVSNAGPDDTNAVVTDTLPAEVTLVATTGCAEDPAGVATCSLGVVPSGGKASYTIEVLIDPSFDGTMTNDVAVSTTDKDPDPTNDSISEDTEVVAEADLKITKDDSDDPVDGGDTLTYTVTVENLGPSDATDVVVTDTLPADVTLISTSGCSEDPNAVPTCSLGDIASGDSKQFTVTVSVDTNASGTLTNEVSVESDTTDPDLGNNQASEDTSLTDAADLSVTKTSNQSEVQATSPLVYEVTVHNDGPVAATNVVVTDTLPGGVTFKSTTGCDDDPVGVPTCSLGTIPAGGTVVYQVRVKVDKATTGTITNEVSVESDITDPDPSDNEDSVTVVVRANPSTKVVDDKSAGFERSRRGWNPQQAGYAQRSFWTVVRKRSVKSSATWTASLDAPGNYRVFVKFPRKNATTRSAKYKIFTTSGIAKRKVNQNNLGNKWVNLGVHEFGLVAKVKLTDKTGESSSSRRRIVIDVVKFVPVGTTVTSEDPVPEGTAEPSPTPAPTAEITPEPIVTAEPEPTEEPTPEPEASPEPTEEPTPEPEASPEPTEEPTPEPEASPEPTEEPTPEPEASPEPTEEPTPEPEASPEPTEEPTPEPEAETIPDDQPPTADAGGPYVLDEGDTVTLDGRGSADSDGEIVSYAWSRQKRLDDPTVPRPLFGAADDRVLDIVLTVTDDDGASDSDSARITVENVAPSLDAFGPYTVTIGDPLVLKDLVISDPGSLDSHTLRVAWGDGKASDGWFDDEGAPRARHTYAETGEYTLKVTVIDDDGGRRSRKGKVTVLAAAEAPGPEPDAPGPDAPAHESGTVDETPATGEDGVPDPATPTPETGS